MTLEQAGKLDFDDAAISEAMRWTSETIYRGLRATARVRKAS